MAAIYETKGGKRFVTQTILLPEGLKEAARKVGINNLSAFCRERLKEEIHNRGAV
jgi:hypothetical protein